MMGRGGRWHGAEARHCVTTAVEQKPKTITGVLQFLVAFRALKSSHGRTNHVLISFAPHFQIFKRHLSIIFSTQAPTWPSA